MARSPSDRGGCILIRGTCPAALLSMLLPLHAVAAAPGGTFDIRQYSNMEMNVRDDTLTVEDVVITHGADTRVEAKFARQTSRPGNVKQLDLSGGVKIDFNGATLAADSAVMIFRGDQLRSVRVEGRQAEFSHQPPGFRRIFGRAGSISMETATGTLVFSGNTSYTDGCNRVDSSRITYDMREGTIADAGGVATDGQAVLCLDGDEGTLQIDHYSDMLINVRNDTIEAQDVQISHGEDMQVEAQSARQTRGPGNLNQLELSGDVKMDFNDATLDASRAVVAFNGDELVSVQVNGSQAQFSHQPTGYPRRVNGRADEIRFETVTGEVSFKGNTSYSDGRFNFSEDLVYDINEGTARDDRNPTTRGQGSIKIGGGDQQQVPPPRTPDRSTAP